MNHTTSLEVSKEMKELGFEQSGGLFYYHELVREPMVFNTIRVPEEHPNILCRAYLFTELLDMIPKGGFLILVSGLYDLTYSNSFDVTAEKKIKEFLTPDALAKLIIQLKREGKL